MASESRVEDALLRIAKEAVSNAVRHAQATEIILTLSFSDEQVELCVRDNGQAFDPDSLGVRYGIGLHSLQERVEARQDESEVADP